jgi:tRNA nucleotidyltransferase (CCA-adding enzyme)
MKRAAPPPPVEAGRLRPELAARVALVARVAAEMGIPTYLVGGTVRDLLLGRDGPDLDFVAVGDGLALAAAVERELGGRLLRHADFLTADVIDREGVHLDIATARQESYAEPAALPEVRPAALEEDLLRRDFTVNAMALFLGGGAGEAGGCGEVGGGGEMGGGKFDRGGLVDQAGGRRDLAAGVLRVLHDRSFLDDPTRLLRGVRFEARLGFRLTPETEALARQAVAAGAFGRLSGSRLRHELELLLGAEPAPDVALAGLARLEELGVLAELHPRLALDGAARRLLAEVGAEHAWYRAAGSPEPPVQQCRLLLLALACGLDDGERRVLGVRLMLAGAELRLLSEFGRRLLAVAPRLGADAAPHEVDDALAGLRGEELLLLAARQGGVVRAWVRRYLTELRPTVLGIRGADLLAAGAPPGPGIGSALHATRDARLDGRIGAGEELDFALAQLGAAAEGDRR